MRDNTTRNAIAKAKRDMIKYEGSTGLLDIAYGIEWEYSLTKDELKVLIEKMKEFNKTHCFNLYS